MRILSPREYNSFKTLAKMTQDNLHKSLYRILKKAYGVERVTLEANWLIAEGDIPIALVAHMDTVFNTPPTEIFYDKEQNVMWSPQGLGADDRAGVFAILQIVSNGYRPHIIFTRDEEWGAVGARNLATTPCPFKDLKYIIELDRCNDNDCVYYECDNGEFANYIEQFGFCESFGTYSDICELCPSWGIAGVNLSVGYRDEHSFIEILHVSALLDTINKVKNMLKNPPEEVFKFEWAYGSYFCKCSLCGVKGTTFTMTPVEDKYGIRMMLCGDCLTKENVEWCNDCYDGFMPGVLKNGLCPECSKTEERLKMIYGSTNTISGNKK